MSRRRSFSITSREHSLDKVQEEPIEEDIESSVSDSGTISTAAKDERDDLVNPYWIEDSDLRKGEVDYLSSAESKFWKDMLDEYLYPIDENKEEQARVAGELKDLRDKCVFAFFMINALFVLIVFLLTLKKDLLHINWPFGVKTNITYIESLQEVHITKEYLQLEPIGLVFVFFFALIMVIQFMAMLFHRFGTLSHILASTDLNFYCTKKAKDLSPNALLDKHAVDIVKQMQQLRDVDDADYDDNTKSGPDRVGRRKTIHKLEKAAQRKRQIGSLDEAFERRFFKINPNDQNSGTTMLKRITMTKETINAFEKRRNTVIEERRKSQMHTFGANSDYSVLSAGVSHRSSTAMSDTRGQLNAAFEDDEDANSIEMQPMNNWNNNNS